jgi:hypothetical protein
LNNDTPYGYLCYRANDTVVIDGDLTKTVWRSAPWTDDFVDIEGASRPRPRYRTRAKMLWDDHYLYIGAELEEPHVWATLTDHDTVIFQDNDFEIFIDPDGDNHDYYEIEINALNTEWDLRLVKPYRDGGPALNAWEIPGLKTAVRVDGTLNDPRDRDRGWCVEVAIPWKALGEFAACAIPPREGDQWRVNFSRVEWDIAVVDGGCVKVPHRKEHNWVWSPQGVIDMHRPERWGYVQFTHRRAGAVAYAPDPSSPARTLLMALYDAQHAYRARHARWATRIEDLDLDSKYEAAANQRLTMVMTAEGYRASLPHVLPDGQTRVCHVQQDSRLWSDPTVGS